VSALEDGVTVPDLEPALKDELVVALATLPDPLFVFKPVRGPDGTVVELTYAFLNEAAARLYGRPIEAILGHGQRELFPSVKEQGIWDSYLAVLESGSPVSFDVPQFRENGVEGSFRLIASRLGDGLLVSATDITRQVKLEREVEAERAMLQATLHSLLDPHVLYEAIRDDSGEVVDFRFVDANPAACEYNKWDRERLIGSTLLDQWPDFATDPTRKAYATVLATGEPIMLDDTAWAQERLFGGQIRHYDLRAVRVSDSILSVTWRDITDRYLKTEYDQRMAVIVERSHEAIIGTVVPEGDVVSWNPAAEQMYGYTAEEMIGRPGLVLVPEHLAAQGRQLANTAAQGEELPDFETTRQRKDGSEIQVSISASTIRDDSGKVTGLVSFHRDITQQVELRKLAAEQQIREKKRLAELEQFERVTVGRELKMIQLKREIEYLKKHGSRPGSDPADQR
jgi:PAS domain S-box-containing protein